MPTEISGLERIWLRILRIIVRGNRHLLERSCGKQPLTSTRSRSPERRRSHTPGAHTAAIGPQFERVCASVDRHPVRCRQRRTDPEDRPRDGAVVRQLGLAESHLNRVARAVQWIRAHYAEPIRVEDVALQAGMSVSSFYRHFQTVTATSPIQFQKQIRLQDARLLPATDPNDVTGVAHLVG